MAYTAPPLDPPGIGTNSPSSHKKRVAYFYDSDVGNYAYQSGHLMKPHRIRMAHSLVMNYGLYNKMEIYRAKPASKYEMTQFHTDEYVDFLQRVTPDNEHLLAKECAKHNVGEDCPPFDGVFEFCAISAGGNIVLAILELLRFHARVLYIDIDVHHGDGVEEAFYTTDRVMCVSLHKYGEFFPGTGDLRDIGIGQGKHYSVNVPLRDGIDDASYKDVFESVTTWAVEFFQPGAIVLQCGADSLSGDRLGAFNLSLAGHANCVNFVKKFNLPTLFLGGGGYTIRNVARAWAYETGQIVGVELSRSMPFTDYYDYYSPDFELDVKPSNMDNRNSAEYLARIKSFVYTNLRQAQPVPSVQLQDVPRYPVGMNENIDEMDDRLDDEDADEETSKDQRSTERMEDRMIEDFMDMSDLEDARGLSSGVNADRGSPSVVEEDSSGKKALSIDHEKDQITKMGPSATNVEQNVVQGVAPAKHVEIIAEPSIVLGPAPILHEPSIVQCINRVDSHTHGLSDAAEAVEVVEDNHELGNEDMGIS
ncbi:hypothetical protein CKM354_000895100 [Cercospora kikuchii]|uniref:histone deacetylase n=1 Tax=Cercospora kikuchii TaxID=84275 RepID=A0A9P3CN10_9PEZI|nr:uncharacterized protein CKM354_000895100 [Cercospora kikuchii]GIZ45799.1 hypothetical protein CKM354_000895100 [Cercospora kikuchii]